MFPITAAFFILHYSWPHYVRSVPGYVWICCCLVLNNMCFWNTIPHRADVKEWRWRRAFTWWRTSYRKAVTSLGDGVCDAVEDSEVNILSNAMGRELMTLNSAAVSALYCSVQVVPQYLHCTLQCLSYPALFELHIAWFVLQYVHCTTVPKVYCGIYTVLQCLISSTKLVLCCSVYIVLQSCWTLV